MSERVTLIKELTLAAKEKNLSGDEVKMYVQNELERINEREFIAKEKDKEEEFIAKEKEKEKEFIAKEKDKDREFQLEMEAKDQERESRAKERESIAKEKERERESRAKELDSQRALILERERAKTREMELSWSQTQQENRRITPTLGRTLIQTVASQMRNYEENLEPIDAWLEQFERMAEAYGLDQTEYSSLVSQNLGGNAQAVYTNLSPVCRNNYKQLKEALFRYYDVSAESYRHRFRSIQKERHETFRQLRERQRTCLNKWIQFSDVTTDYDGLFELCLQEQMMQTLPSDTLRFVKERGATNLEDIIRLADRFASAQEEFEERHNYDNKHHTIAVGLTRQHNSAKPTKATKDQSRPSSSNGNNNGHKRRRNNDNKSSALSTDQFITDPHVSPRSDERNNRRSSPDTWSQCRDNNDNQSTPKYFHMLQSRQDVSEMNQVPTRAQPNNVTSTQDKTRVQNITQKSEHKPNLHIDTEVAPKGIVYNAPAYLFAAYSLKTPVVETKGNTTHPAAHNSSVDETQCNSKQPTHAELRLAQLNDPTLYPCFAKLNKSRRSIRHGNYIQKKGLLYKVAKHNRTQLCVPASYRTRVMKTILDRSGFSRLSNFVQRVRSCYFWPSLYTDALEFLTVNDREQPIAIKQARARKTQYHEKTMRKNGFRVDDRVLILLPAGRQKLKMIWKGPFTITQKVSPTIYRIDVHGTKRTYHVNLLKRYHDYVTGNGTTDSITRPLSLHGLSIKTCLDSDRRTNSHPDQNKVSSGVTCIQGTRNKRRHTPRTHMRTTFVDDHTSSK